VATHRAAEPGAGDQPDQRRHQRRRHGDDDDLQIGDGRAEELVRSSRQQRREGVVVAAPADHRQLLQHDGHADGGDQRR